MGATESTLVPYQGNPDTAQYVVVTEEGIGNTYGYFFVNRNAADDYYDARGCCRKLYRRNGDLLRDNGSHTGKTITAAFALYRDQHLQ